MLYKIVWKTDSSRMCSLDLQIRLFGIVGSDTGG
jgi:hypothetical protein